MYQICDNCEQKITYDKRFYKDSNGNKQCGACYIRKYREATAPPVANNQVECEESEPKRIKLDYKRYSFTKKK